MQLSRKLSVPVALSLLGAGGIGASAKAAPPAKPLPSIVLVHGAFADGSSWDRVVPLLQAKRYTVVSLHEPVTSGGWFGQALLDRFGGAFLQLLQIGDEALYGAHVSRLAVTGNDDRGTGRRK